MPAERLKFHAAVSPQEYKNAYALALKIFEPDSGMTNYALFKSMLWAEDPTFALKNLILASTAKGRLVGLVRIVPRFIFRGRQKISVAGLSSICLDPQYRGKGYSLSLMEHALSLCQQRGYDLALLIARRATDHYYQRFGFWGVASYNQAGLTTSCPQQGKRSYRLSAFHRSRLPLYKKAYDQNYGETFGRVERSPAYWDFLVRRIASMKNTVLRTVEREGKPIGYVITVGESVVELATLGGAVSWESLARTLSPKTPTVKLSVRLPADHPLFRDLSGTDCTLSFRECRYGGHMVKVLNTHHMLDLLRERVERQCRKLRLGTFSEHREGIGLSWNPRTGRLRTSFSARLPLSFDATLRLLGVDPLRLKNSWIDPSCAFNLGFVDEF